ncbi:MAG: carboxy-S-adenosyl-L-methionine synthase CmoA [Desulfobulbaceae bacterium]|nr:carboxy-S-adenosyl-L-methionine synthase CmoA [Desulfobulbaceae bacterium]
MSRDNLYADGEIKEDFRFTEGVAEVFDDMLSRSVPGYAQVIEMSAQLLGRFLKPEERVYDLGCSTGATLLKLAKRLEPLSLHFTGIDNSAPMIAKARRKAEMYGKQEQLTFIENDILDADLPDAGAIILNYTMQFIRPMLRADFLQKICTALRPGGVLIMSEKILSPDPLINRAFIDCYLDFKRSQGYSELEISRKREALENVLIPFTMAENIDLLQRAGFTRVEPFCQWFNFVSILAVK